MSIGSLGLYRADGRLRGSYVYMLLCRDDGPIYIKVGVTDAPDDRLLTLRNGCPVPPRYFYSIERPSRRKALNLERALHDGFDAWRAHGEWFRFKLEDRQSFNEAWRSVLASHLVPGWPSKWDRVAVQPIVEEKQRRSRFKVRLVLNRGRSYADFARQQGT